MIDDGDDADSKEESEFHKEIRKEQGHHHMIHHEQNEHLHHHEFPIVHIDHEEGVHQDPGKLKTSFVECICFISVQSLCVLRL